MGYLKDQGKTLTFEQSKKFQKKIKEEGIQQFLNLTKKYLNYELKNLHEQLIKEAPFDQLKKLVFWGDEIEGHVIMFDDKSQKVKLVTNTANIYEQYHKDKANKTYEIHQEYGQWMIELTPTKAYSTLCSWSDAVYNIRNRFLDVKKSYLQANEHFLTIPVFPILGCKNYDYFDVHSQSPEQLNAITQSLFIDDRLINTHPRFPTLTQNILQRRGKKVEIKVPLFVDKKTNIEKTDEEPYPGFIYMDAMAFGMGNCCLQATFSALDFPHSRWLYDQLSILCPIFLAMTAGSPIFKGKLADVDCRWDVIASSVDCRTDDERDPKSQNYIPKSRYSSISKYISDDPRNLPAYNDINFALNKEYMQYAKSFADKIQLKLDEKMYEHIGFLYQRDALVIFEDKIDVSLDSTAHFENIQSTNWNSVRLKPPPSFDSIIGWRVEFRPMEIQLTADENAAFVIFVQIMVRLLYEQWFKLNFYLPISYVDINFQRAQKKNALLEEKFYFRTNIFDDGQPKIEQLSIYEIFFGAKQYNFLGLVQIMENFKKQWSQRLDGKNFCCPIGFKHIIQFLEDRLTGKSLTLASWIRQFVMQHKDYKQDSVISEQIAYDLCKRLVGIASGQIIEKNFQNIWPPEI